MEGVGCVQEAGEDSTEHAFPLRAKSILSRPTKMAYYWALLLDPSLAVLVVVAVATIYHSNTRTRTAKTSVTTTAVIPVAEEEEMRDTLSPWKIIILPVVGSLVLIILFYFLKILKYLLIGIVAFSSFSSVSFVLYPLWYHLLESAPGSIRYRTFKVPQKIGGCLGVSRLPTAVPVAMFGSLGLIVAWLVSSNWLVVDLIAICLAITGIVSIQLPSAMLATLLLCIFWVYDIFWVFISPLIFPKNVMETVAVGVAQLELPMIFKIPRLSQHVASVGGSNMPFFANLFFGVFERFDANMTQLFSPGFLMLGLGDIILPGLALNYFYRRDKMLQQALEDEGIPTHKMRLTFYSVAQLGYTFGLLLTFVMLIFLKRAQPALLYLVPCTLIPPFLLAAKRGQLGWLWRSLPAPASDIESNDAAADATSGEQSDQVEGLAQSGEEVEMLDESEPVALEADAAAHWEKQPLTSDAR